MGSLLRYGNISADILDAEYERWYPVGGKSELTRTVPYLSMVLHNEGGFIPVQYMLDVTRVTRLVDMVSWYPCSILVK